MISDGSMQALRCSAAIVGALPTAHLRIRVDERVLVEVTRLPTATGPTPHVHACAFRTAVARAHQERSAGQDIRFLSLPDGVDPAIDIGVVGGVVLPGTIVRSTFDTRWVHAVVVASPLDRCSAAMGAELAWLNRRYDEELEVTLLFTTTPIGDKTRSSVAVDALTDALVRCTVADIEAYVALQSQAGGPAR